jgi:predicted metalloprotease with PDZ domain
MRSTTLLLALAAAALGAAVSPLHAQEREARVEAERSRAIAPRAMQFTRQPRAVLGLSTSSSGAQDTLGVLVASVTPDSPAAAAGIKEGDRLLAVNGVNLRISAADAADPIVGNLGARRLTRELGTRNPGDEVELKVQSGNQVRTVRARLADAATLARSQVAARAGGSGSTVYRATTRNRASLGVQVGSSGSRRDTLGIFIMSADDEGPAARAGVIEGMRIAAINGTDLRVPASDAEDNLVIRSRAQRLTRALADVNPGDEVELRVWQNGQYRNVRVRTVPSDSLSRNRSTFIIGDGMGMQGLDVLPPGIRIEGMPMLPSRVRIERLREMPTRVRIQELREMRELPARVPLERLDEALRRIPLERVEAGPSRRYH